MAARRLATLGVGRGDVAGEADTGLDEKVEHLVDAVTQQGFAVVLVTRDRGNLAAVAHVVQLLADVAAVLGGGGRYQHQFDARNVEPLRTSRYSGR